MGGDTGCAPGLEDICVGGYFSTSFEAVTDRIDPGCLGLVSTDFPAVCDLKHDVQPGWPHLWPLYAQ